MGGLLFGCFVAFGGFGEYFRVVFFVCLWFWVIFLNKYTYPHLIKKTFHSSFAFVDAKNPEFTGKM